jgi:hypothetical protein
MEQQFEAVLKQHKEALAGQLRDIYQQLANIQQQVNDLQTRAVKYQGAIEEIDHLLSVKVEDQLSDNG